MTKKISRFFLYFLIILIIFLVYFTYFGIETKRFNQLIKDEITKGNFIKTTTVCSSMGPGIKIDYNKVD